MPLRNAGSIRQTNRISRRDESPRRQRRFLLRQSRVRKPGSLPFHLNVDLIILCPEKWSLFDADSLEIFQDAQSMNAMNQNDRVAGGELNLTKQLAAVAVKFDNYAAALHNEHLL